MTYKQNYLHSVLIGLISVLVLILSYPRIISLFDLLPVKYEMGLKQLSEEQFQAVKVAIDSASNSHGAPEYYFLKERQISRTKFSSATPEDEKANIDERIRLLNAGLAGAGARPFELARLAHLYAFKGDSVRAKSALDLSILTGPFIRPLYATRFLTLSKLWPGLSDKDKKSYSKVIRLVYTQRKSWLITRAKKIQVIRKMMAYHFGADLKELIKFYRLVLS